MTQYSEINLSQNIHVAQSGKDIINIPREVILPYLTSDNAPIPFVVSTNYNTIPYQGFDGNSTTLLRSDNTVTTGIVTIDLGSINKCAVIKYSMCCQVNYKTRAPKDWTFEGSNDNSNWDILDIRTNITSWTNYIDNVFLFSNNIAYRYYRINVTANNGDTYLVYNNIQFYKRLQVNYEKILYDRDTTNVYYKTVKSTTIQNVFSQGTESATLLTDTQKNNLNSIQISSGYKNYEHPQCFWFNFPKGRKVNSFSILYGCGDSRIGDISSLIIEASNDSTNGADGNWHNGIWSGMPQHYVQLEDTNFRNVDFLIENITWLRIGSTGTAWTVSPLIYNIFLYNEIEIVHDETNKSQILSINQELNEIFAGFKITFLAQINNNIYISWAWVNE